MPNDVLQNKILSEGEANEAKMAENDPRRRILDRAAEKFFSRGYIRVTMDEMAEELGMSKKTLYKYFPSKSDLLQQITRHFILDVIAQQDRILNDASLDFDKRLSEIMKLLARVAAKIGPSFLKDIQRVAPEIWQTIEEVRQLRIQLVFGRLLSEGQRKGLVRRDLNQPFLVLLLAGMIREMVNPNVVSQYSVSLIEAFETVRRVFLSGVLTDKGREKYVNRNHSPASKKETRP